ncbi:MAG: 16S rRNA (guanine(527)-N(7))-methyltransferase RsmG [Muribaculaceae bacterium]|nr:16S rRNA (guanine(527)-N(7))-methyltransferase RsmG [Muribaculaceae bacterium]
MESSEIITAAFSDLTERQRSQFAALGNLYAEWNSRINVISRKDIDNLYTRHILHSLAIARLWGNLADGTRILDIGTGGGFPGIPLAIMYPGAHFHLIDRIGKKIRVASEVAAALGLDNVSFQHGDIGECRERFDFVVSRAVMPLDKLVKLIDKNVARTPDPRPGNAFHNGLFTLKGGDLSEESAAVPYPVVEYSVHEFFNDPFFDTKLIVYVPIGKK